MRLLRFDDAGNLVLTDFSGRNIPSYAILSHRWGDDEVLLEDVRNNSYKEKTGCQKIEFCARQAARDQLEYFWIDTCCIDSWNILERSRAVNSMYSWYRDAARCYVFLPDLPVSGVTDGLQKSPWQEALRTSEWFTRGWTLQELIAPQSVELFSSDGHRLGDKESLESTLCEITGVPAEVLRSCTPENFSTSERISWAKDRKTTEPEDEVYCLLGILDVTMPTSYGEGKKKALERLEYELNSANDAPYIIPYSRNLQFVGRESQLAELEGMLFSDKQTTKIALLGPGGTGKSQLALELAYTLREKDKSCSVFWVDVSSRDSLRQGYTNIAQKLNIPGWHNEEADVRRLVKYHLSREDGQRWLLFLDNADDVDLELAGLSTSSSINSIDYLPQSKHGSIVFTTTNGDAAGKLANQNIVVLQELTPYAAQKMLDNYLINPRPKGEKGKEELLSELSYLPLAIVQAAAYINLTNTSLERYRSQLVKLRGQSTEDSVTTTLLISLDKIRHEHSLAAEYLFLTACLNWKDVPLDLLGTTSLSEREDAIRLLNNYALVTRRPAASALDVHRLVHYAVRNWLQEQQWLQGSTERAVGRLLVLFPDDQWVNRSKWRRLLPHAQYVLSSDTIDQDHTATTDLAWRCAMALFRDGRWKEAEPFFMQVSQSYKRVLGEEHPQTLTSLNNLAETYRQQKQWTKAEELSIQVLEAEKRILGEEHPDTLLCMSSLALTYRETGRLKRAEECFLLIIETMERVLGEEHLNTLIITVNLVCIYTDQKRWAEAEELAVQVTDKMERVLGKENPMTLTTMANLATIYADQGLWEEAEEAFAQVTESQKRVLGEEHPDTLNNIGHLASAYFNQGRWEEAEELLTQVAETEKRVLGEEHPDTLISMANLASTYNKQKRWKEAEKLLIQVTESQKQVLGEEHLDAISSISHLAFACYNQRRWREAEELFTQVAETRKRLLGEEHPDTLIPMTNLANTWWHLGRLQSALELLTSCAALSNASLGSQHPDTIERYQWKQILEDEVERKSQQCFGRKEDSARETIDSKVE